MVIFRKGGTIQRPWPFIVILFLLWVIPVPGYGEDNDLSYVGSLVCSQCHEEQYDSFKTHSKKSRSFSSILKMKRGLTAEELEGCYNCHSTGYGKPGGFVSEEKTPHLKDAGCEVCQGPGSLHAETEDPEDIKGDLSVGDCETCHNEARIGAFNYKPLIYGGAH